MTVSIASRYLSIRTLGLILFYALLCGLSYFVSYQLRFDFNVPDDWSLTLVNTIWWVVGLKLMLLIAAGQVDCVLSYFRLPDAVRLSFGLFATSLILASMWYLYDGNGVPPRAVILADFQLSFLLLAGFRVAMRVKASSGLEDWLTWEDAENVLIVGAGEVGAGLCTELKQKARLGMRPVAFLDDDKRKIGRYVHGVLVADNIDGLSEVAKRLSAHKVVIAFPSAPGGRVRKVTEMAREAGLAVDTVPALTDLVSGRAQMTQLRPVELEDLLGRDTIDLNSDGIRSMLAGKRVLVTGAGGSIGRELVAQVLEYAPASLLCIDQAEIAIFNLQQEVLAQRDMSELAQTLILDVHQTDEVEAVFKRYQPEVIFHAAAHKHVNLMEAQPAESLKNNFFTTASLARLASQFAVERFILISTDKAINPTSVMGASKRLAELSLLEQQKAEGNTTKFMAVRFGNVLGSSGSVIPIFKRQIAKGGPVTVTDPEVTRFFMTVQEAVGLVLQSATPGTGGEIFVLDMGQSMKILDVARQMIALSGFQEGEDIEIVFTGLKPGEKLYEEVQHLSETHEPTDHPRVMRFVAGGERADSVDAMREALTVLADSDANEIKQAIRRFVPEYRPHFD
ncbi:MULTISPECIES: nucleoside-diphosphate sugar epimerase/dehydratase [unclassified Lentimonas]|uniref:polysaccharide biosynthesis protein n=1 Tax=unclassified Lentimonas TaxID=2630993 RepID=UPI001325ADE6|nr:MULTISPECIES: nucleoside-diphosphate sugar epimerase/dehydratase [unclassified Lentimonas]CAA6691292.1 UDP-N-acetylglucosamine 4,6-dehydratase (EC [Lentimonas sp. CC19]CAA6694874.1 UDP-N-acetylglucosamine 4,6-dehydratase (EC [Lentimonas sp. CC10]CAA7071934.1 UDP-N-acetylglucosamine 4,6-dehydratase (EC [Lentimonas sp. CC11]